MLDEEMSEEVSEVQKRIRHLKCELDNLELMYKATKGVRDELEKENEELKSFCTKLIKANNELRKSLRKYEIVPDIDYLPNGLEVYKENVGNKPYGIKQMGDSGMTDEEKLEIKNRLSDIGAKVGELALNYIEKLEKENAELKEQIPQWHDLRKNPNDLPKENKEYLVAYKNFLNQEEIVVEICNWNIYKFVDDEYIDIPWFECKDVLIAWSEIPKFEE